MPDLPSPWRPPRSFRLLVVAIAVGGCAPPVRSTTPSSPLATADTLSRAERLRVVDAMTRHVRQHFAHWEPLGAQSWDSLVAHFRADAERSTTRWQFDSAALAFTAALKNGHTRFSDSRLWRTRGAPLWLQLRPTADGWLVTMSEIDGLARGDVVTAIDSEPIEQFYAARRHLIAESSERTRRAGLTASDFLFPMRFTVTTADGRRVAVTRGVPSNEVVAARRAGPLVPHRWLVPDSIGYVRIRRFSPRAFEDSALAIVAREYARAPALIVDVRSNGGGSTPQRLMHALRGGRSLSRLPIERSTIGSDRLAVLRTLRPAGTSLQYRGLVIVLADQGCGSACDDFVAPFAAATDARVIGDTTWGSTGQPQLLDLGNGMSLQVSARRYTQIDGSRFEGVGVAPHIVVPLRAAELRAGHDAVLDRAIAEARAGLARDGGMRGMERNRW